jgi:AcrR family transcriptional regulator
MTRHRKPDEWIEEILAAAGDEIEEKGYPALTMDAIAGRIELSKDSVYRFFANKTEVALALFTRCYRDSLVVDVEEAIGWNLPPAQTFFRVALRFQTSKQETARQDRIWLALMPEVLRDDRFKMERLRLLDQIVRKFGEIAVRLAQRDNLEIPEGFEGRVERNIRLGVVLFEGFTIQGSLGASREEQEDLARHFMEVLVTDTLGTPGDSEKGAVG